MVKKGSRDFFKNSGSLDQEIVIFFLVLQNFLLDVLLFFIKGKDDMKNSKPSGPAFQMCQHDLVWSPRFPCGGKKPFLVHVALNGIQLSGYYFETILMKGNGK